MNLEFNKLNRKHLPYFYEIRFSVTENILHSHQIQYMLRNQALEDIDQGGGWICSIDGDYAGICFGIYIPEPLIAGLFVKPEYQSLGIGTKLLELVTQWFYDKGEKRIDLTTDPGSKAEMFYTKKGWIADGLDEYQQLKLFRRIR